VVKPSGQIKEDAKTRILDAADAVFVRRGVDGARMQQIADHAGVNKSLLHYYFRSKADLAQAVWLRIASSFIPGLFHMLSSDCSLDEKIDRVVDSYHTLLSRHPYLVTYIVSEASRRPALVDDFYSSERREAARRMIGKLREQIDEQVKRKKMAPLSAEQFLVTLLSSCQFPFMAQTILMRATGLAPPEFLKLMERRRTELPAFLKRALKP
jgi:AcrR family transcriptional regulator